MEAYLDNSATTKVYPKVREKMVDAMEVEYGNPSSRHKKGMEGEKLVREARETIARVLKVQEKEIIFTSGGTESNNMAIIGAAMANRRAGMHIITSTVEHASVGEPMRYLEEQGFRVTWLPVDEYGVISLDALREAICDDTILISLMYVNNEVGALQPVAEAAAVIKERKPDILFHVDAIQAFGKYEIHPKRIGIDMLSVSGHKIHGPKGSGFLYVRDKVKIKPLILGGGQQKGMRSGTENVPGYAGLGEAVKEVYAGLGASVARMTELKDYFIDELQKTEGVRVNSRRGALGAPHIVSVSFSGVRSEVLLHALEDKGIYISSGSACSSNHPGLSGTLQAMGIARDLLDSTVRFSFCESTTKEELDYTLSELRKLLPILRKYRAH